LKGRLESQQAKLAKKEGTRALMGAVSMMRTLRRANARECSWANDGTVDTGAVTDQAFKLLASSPCAPQVVAELKAAENLSGAEREAAQEAAITKLFDDAEGCSSSAATGPEINDADSDSLEEEMDETTDELVESMSESPESSLIQEDRWMGYGAGALWQVSFFAGLPVFIGTILFTIVLSMACGKLVHMLVSLYEEPEKPTDPLAYLKALFEADNLDTADVETLKLENTELKHKLGEANEEIAELKAKVAELSSEGNEEAQ